MFHSIRCFLFFLILNPSLTIGQQMIYAGIEAGFYSFQNEVKEKSRIRQFDSYTGPFESNNYNIRSTYESSFAGIKIESFFANKWTWGAGLRYARMSSTIERYRYSPGQDFFYYLIEEGANEVEYYRVRKLRQNANYIGVPLDLKFYPVNRKFKLYVKAGPEFNFNLHSSGDIGFVDPGMDPYEKEVINSFKKPATLSIFISFSAGASYGKVGGPVYGFEVSAPTFSATSDAGGLVTPSLAGGLLVFVKVPLNNAE